MYTNSNIMIRSFLAYLVNPFCAILFLLFCIVLHFQNNSSRIDRIIIITINENT